MEFDDRGLHPFGPRPSARPARSSSCLTAGHGKYAAHVAGGASRRMKPVLQAGARVILRYRARMSDQLGSATLEPVGEGPSALFDDPLALAGLAAAAAVAGGALPEREPHPGAFLAFEALTGSPGRPRHLAGGLRALRGGPAAGAGLRPRPHPLRRHRRRRRPDLCQPAHRPGGERAAGEAYKDRLLRLPAFLLSAQGRLGPGDIAAGLALTGHFLETFVFAALNRPLPPARLWLIDRLRDAGRL